MELLRKEMGVYIMEKGKVVIIGGNKRAGKTTLQ